MSMSRDRAISICETNQAFFNSKDFRESIINSIEKSYIQSSFDPILEDCVEKPNITITDSDSVSTLRLHRIIGGKSAKIAVLNFASATRPGGGYTSGSSAQEEDLCRASTLYPVISNSKFEDFYYLGYNTYPRYTNNLIYCKDILFFRHQNGTMTDEYVTADVITCAAPNCSGTSYIHNIEEILNMRAAAIIAAASANNIETLILGAFGCGVFKNDPSLVANAFKIALGSNHKIKKVIFPMFSIINPANKYFREVLLGHDI